MSSTIGLRMRKLCASMRRKTSLFMLLLLFSSLISAAKDPEKFGDSKPLTDELVKDWTAGGFAVQNQSVMPRFKGSWNPAIGRLPNPQVEFELDLSGSEVGDADLSKLVGFENLASLNLEFTAVTDAGLRNLRSLKKLSKLKLRGGESVSGEGVDGLDNLTELYMFETGVTSAGVKTVAKLRKLPVLLLRDSRVRYDQNVVGNFVPESPVIDEESGSGRSHSDVDDTSDCHDATPFNL